MELSVKDFNFLDSFDHLDSHDLDEHGKNKIDLFVLNINAIPPVSAYIYGSDTICANEKNAAEINIDFVGFPHSYLKY